MTGSSSFLFFLLQFEYSSLIATTSPNRILFTVLTLRSERRDTGMSAKSEDLVEPAVIGPS